jgi:hypothetical protein
MGPLPSGAQVGQGGRKHRFLGGDKPLQVVKIATSHSALHRMFARAATQVL